MTTQTSGARIDRKTLWLAIAGGVGIAIGIVALVIAISAQNATTNDAKITAQVNRDARLAVAGIHSQLQQDVASATAVLRQLQAGSTAASRTDGKLLRDVNQNKSGVAGNSASIGKMQASINTLNGEVGKLNSTVTNLGASEQALTKRVNALEKAQPHP
jgi:chromosome segregation ATPase